MRNDGTVFTDHDVHRMLRINGQRKKEESGIGAQWLKSKQRSLLFGRDN